MDFETASWLLPLVFAAGFTVAGIWKKDTFVITLGVFALSIWIMMMVVFATVRWEDFEDGPLPVEIRLKEF